MTTDLPAAAGDLRPHEVSASRWARIGVPIGGAMFIIALVGAAAVVPVLRPLHFFQALIYVAVIYFARRDSAVAFGAGVTIAVAWNILQLFVTHNAQGGVVAFYAFLTRAAQRAIVLRRRRQARACCVVDWNRIELNLERFRPAVEEPVREPDECADRLDVALAELEDVRLVNVDGETPRSRSVRPRSPRRASRRRHVTHPPPALPHAPRRVAGRSRHVTDHGHGIHLHRLVGFRKEPQNRLQSFARRQRANHELALVERKGGARQRACMTDGRARIRLDRHVHTRRRIFEADGATLLPKRFRLWRQGRAIDHQAVDRRDRRGVAVLDEQVGTRPGAEVMAAIAATAGENRIMGCVGG